MPEIDDDRIDEIVRRYTNLWNGSLDDLDVMGDSVSVYDPAAPDGELHGLDEFESFLSDVWTAFPDFEITPEEVAVTDDTIMLEWTLTCTHTGDLNGVPPTGRAVELSGMTKLVISEEEIVEDHIYYDYNEFVNQLGLTFPDILKLLPKLAGEKVKDLT